MGMIADTGIGNTFRINPGDFRIQDWLLDAPISGGAKFTFSVLATCARGRDYVWPGIEYLAQRISSSHKTVYRHINELVEFGLLKKSRMKFKGQVRNVYFFVQHQIVKLYPNQVDKMTDCSESGPDPEGAKQSNCPEQPAKMSDCNNKEYENTKGKEESNPPLPPLVPVNDSSAAPIDLKGGEDNNSDLPEEQITDHFSERYDGYSPALKQAKERLIERSDKALGATWLYAIKQSIWEELNCGKVLIRLTNQFTLSYLKSKYQDFFKIADALMLEMGYNNYEFCVYTQEQSDRADHEAKQAEIARLAEETRKKQSHEAAVEEKVKNLDLLPAEKKFEILFDFYGLDKKRRMAKEVFLDMHQKGLLPSMKTMMDSIDDHAKHDYWWIQRSRPLMAKWLQENGWEDKPYAARN